MFFHNFRFQPITSENLATGKIVYNNLYNFYVKSRIFGGKFRPKMFFFREELRSTFPAEIFVKKVFPQLRFLTKIPILAKKIIFWPIISIFEFLFEFFSENIFFDYRNEIYAIDYPRKSKKWWKLFIEKKSYVWQKKIKIIKNFGKKIEKKIFFWRKFPREISAGNYDRKFRAKILSVIFRRNLPRRITVNFCGANFRNFRQKYFFSPNFFFRTENSKFFHNFDFWPKFLFWPKKSLFDKKCRF